MMFNNIIYFIIVLVIFNTNFPEHPPEDSFLFSITMMIVTWLIFACYCYLGFGGILRRFDHSRASAGQLTHQYYRLTAKLSILSIFLFALAVYLFNLKYWLQWIPGFERSSLLQGTAALSLFLTYLGTIWYFGHPAQSLIFRARIKRSSFIFSHFRLNLPILFPWMILSLVYDLLALTPWAGPGGYLNTLQGQLIFLISFLAILMVFMPGFIQHWWGCKPLGHSEKSRQLEEFLHGKGFKYRHLLRWPIFEGKMMTAGIMGILPSYRYILISDSLLDVLSISELKGVLAHEMGHAKYRHLLFYLVFFVGFMVISFGLSDLLFYLLYTHPFFLDIMNGKQSQGTNLFYLILSIPMLFTLLVYFRYVMGFFMRNFERQADLYSGVTMGTPEPVISSLEKIALLSGKTRDLPSWHHFSIRERVEYLWRTLKEPDLVRRHNRFIGIAILIYLVSLGGVGYALNFSPMKQYLTYSLIGKVINQQLLNEPDNIDLYQNLAMVYQHTGKYGEAIRAYEKIIDLDPNQAIALNNLAWLLVTAPDETMRDKARALDLAKRATSIEKSPVFLDTLAEAYYLNHQNQAAVATIKQAIALAKKNREYYEKQLEKFLSSSERNIH
jgi:tetratricopeptide (TPR) repeat protein